ncbi:UNVERIFIED_CONTAM: zinc finger protein [Trichonephila clavipes]
MYHWKWKSKSPFACSYKEKPYVCEICNKAFSERSSLRNHFRVHTKEKHYIAKQRIFLCNQACLHVKQKQLLKKSNKSFTERYTVKTKILNHSGHNFFNDHDERKELKGQFRIHAYRTHNTCEFCNKHFPRYGDLKIHLRLHTNGKPYIYEFCNRAFSQICNLKKHFLIHTQEKPYVCEVFGKAFSDRSNLKKHFLILTQEKPYVFEIYSKAFTRNGDLKIHLCVHTKEIPFACEIVTRLSPEKVA